MKLLVLSNNPDRASFRQRIGIHIPSLQERGIACEVAKLPGGAWQRRRLFQQAAAFDAVLLHRKILTLWDAFWLRRYHRKLLYDFDDAIMYNDRRPQETSRIRFRRFGRSVRLADRIIAGNPYLADHARRYNPSVTVLPTGLDLQPYIIPPPRPGDKKVRLVWIGSRSTLRYLADIRPALEEVGKHHGNVVLRIICDEFLDLQNMTVEKILWSQENEVKNLLESDIGLAPLPDNAFTRGKCGFKILQYEAASLPVVASPVGVNAAYARDGITGFHATDHREWVRAIGKLVVDPEQRRSMGQAGREAVEPFSLPVIGQRFCEIIAECVREESPARSHSYFSAGHVTPPEGDSHDNMSNKGPPRVERTIKDRMEVIAGLVKGRRTLDLGIVDSRRNRQGTAERLARKPNLLFRRICEINPDALGIDIDNEGVDILRQQGYNTRMADVMTMDLGQLFEVIVAGELIEHLPDPGQFLRNVRRHLTPDGTVVITTPNPFYWAQIWRIWRHHEPHVHEEHTCWFDPITLQRLCRLSGLEPYATYWVKPRNKNVLKIWPRWFRDYFSESFMILARPASSPSCETGRT